MEFSEGNEVVRKMWQVPAMAYYFSTFHTVFGTAKETPLLQVPDISVERLEEALCSGGTQLPDWALIDLHIRLLRGLLDDHTVGQHDWEVRLQKWVTDVDPDRPNPMRDEIGGYRALSVAQRVLVLHRLCEDRIGAKDMKRGTFGNAQINSWQPSAIRVQPFGFGNDRKSTYWFFDGSQKIRLYREIDNRPKPKPASAAKGGTLPADASARVANGAGHHDDAFGNYSSYGRTPGEAKGRKGEVGRKWDDQDDKLLQRLHKKNSGNWEKIVLLFNKQPGEGRQRTKKAMQHRMASLRRAVARKAIGAGGSNGTTPAPAPAPAPALAPAPVPARPSVSLTRAESPTASDFRFGKLRFGKLSTGAMCPAAQSEDPAKKYDIDGKAYTLTQFIAHYGGNVEAPPTAWKTASITPLVSSFACVICGADDDADAVICDGCNEASHLACIQLDEVPEDDWFCHKCIEERQAKRRKVEHPSSPKPKQRQVGQQRLAASADSERPTPSSEMEIPQLDGSMDVEGDGDGDVEGDGDGGAEGDGDGDVEGDGAGDTATKENKDYVAVDAAATVAKSEDGDVVIEAEDGDTPQEVGIAAPKGEADAGDSSAPAKQEYDSMMDGLEDNEPAMMDSIESHAAPRPAEGEIIKVEIAGDDGLSRSERNGLMYLGRNAGSWSFDELRIFYVTLRDHGKDYTEIAKRLKFSKSREQCCSYYNNWVRRYPPMNEWLGNFAAKGFASDDFAKKTAAARSKVRSASRPNDPPPKLTGPSISPFDPESHDKLLVWEIVCEKVSDWTDLAETLQCKKGTPQYAMWRQIKDNIAPTLAQEWAAEERKRIKQEFWDAQPRRVSSRAQAMAEKKAEQEAEEGLKLQREEDEKQRRKAVLEARAAEKEKRERAERATAREREKLEQKEARALEREHRAVRGRICNQLAAQYPWFRNVRKVAIKIETYSNAYIFRDPVTEDMAPGYFDMIESPCCLKDVRNRLESGTYTSMEQFADDMYLIFDNCDDFNWQVPELLALSDKSCKYFEREMQKVFGASAAVGFSRENIIAAIEAATGEIHRSKRPKRIHVGVDSSAATAPPGPLANLPPPPPQMLDGRSMAPASAVTASAGGHDLAPATKAETPAAIPPTPAASVSATDAPAAAQPPTQPAPMAQPAPTAVVTQVAANLEVHSTSLSVADSAWQQPPDPAVDKGPH